MHSEDPRRVTDDGGRIEPTKRQAQTKRKHGPKVDGLGQEGVDQRGNRVMGPRRTRLNRHRRNLSHSTPFLGTFRRMCRFGGGGCRKDFRRRGENLKEWASRRCATCAHVCRYGGGFIPHCNALSPLDYKRREVSFEEVAHFELVGYTT